MEPTLTCPKCNAEIKLTESLAAPLIASVRQEYESRLTAKENEVSTREASLREKESALAKEKSQIELTVQEKLIKERSQIASEEAKKAKLALSVEMEQKAKEISELNECIKGQNDKLAEAQKTQADLLRKSRELDDAKRELDLTVEKRIQDGLTSIREQARKEAEDSLNLKLQEREHTISSMQKQIEDLKRRAEQGSQQLQGEVLELEIESLLRSRFPHDIIEPVPKGEFGGDILQKVVNTSGKICGSIIWESKRTKTWSDSWLAKLRDDQRRANAEIAVMVSQTLPKEQDTFNLVDEIWVSPPRTALPLAIALRQSLIEISSARQASQGQQTKTELVYQYLTGTRFKQRVQAIVEAFSSMKEDLDKEKKVITKQWAKRDEQIENVLQATAGLYGDLQGIAGKSIQEIEGLEMKALGNNEES